MPEEKKLTTLQRQKAARPLVEDSIRELLDGETRQTALDFAAWMRENRMKPSWYLINKWKASYKSKTICNLHISWYGKNGFHRGYYDSSGGSVAWYINPCLSHMDMYNEQIKSEGLADFIRDNAFSCVYSGKSPSPGVGCSPGKPCAPGRGVTILDREIENNCCGHFTMLVWNPDQTAVNKVKRLLELEQAARDQIKNNKKGANQP